MPNSSKAIETYIDEELTRADGQHDSRLDQIKFNANEPYNDVASVTFDMTPIAIAQEPPAFTARMLEITHKQMFSQSVQPFSVVLSANYPDVDNPKYEANRAENLRIIKAFQDSAAGQQLPLSFYEQVYDPRTSIGKIRRDLAHVALHGMRAQHRKSPIPQHANLLISDVDTWQYSPAYLPRQQEAIEAGYSWAAANKRYLTSNGNYPNMDRAIHAINLLQILSPAANYDCHSTYAVKTFVEGDNFDADDTEYETHLMRERAKKALGKDYVEPAPRQIPGAIAVSYPRRPFEKFRNGYGMYGFWVPGEFGMHNKYREGVAEDTDISLESSNHFVAERISAITSRVRDELVSNYLDEHGDASRFEVRCATDDHIAAILRHADNRLNLQLDKLRFLDAVVNPSRQN